MADYTELKRLAEAFPADLDWDSNTEPFFNGPSGESLGGGSTGFYCVYGAPFEIDGEQYDGHTYVETCKADFAKFMVAAREGVLALIAENERLAANVKLNLCDHPAIHQGDVDLLVAFVAGTSQMELAKVHGCTPPNISRKIRRVKDRLGWREGMLVSEIRDRAERLRALASQGAFVTADLMSERDQLRAEVAGLKTGYEAYERVNAELKAENELARMRIKEMDLLFGRYILAMRSALIEEEHGKGPAAAMEWIYNSLAGPGELPPEGETDSQAYFDREIVAVDNGMQDVMAFHEGRRAAMGKGEQS